MQTTTLERDRLWCTNIEGAAYQQWNHNTDRFYSHIVRAVSHRYLGTDYEYRDVFRFALIETNSGADLLIQVYYGGSLVYEQTYASNPFTVGKIALAKFGAKTYSDLIEVLLLPQLKIGLDRTRKDRYDAYRIE